MLTGELGRLRAVLLLVLVAVVLNGCYYAQAVRGQLDVLQRREPIQDVIEREPADSELARRLALLREARDFSIAELGLPDNDSYRGYADLERDYVVWNVFAAPEFSLLPKRWCFPVAGCVAYRGYFSESAAERKAGSLRRAGYDVAVGGVAAYSTLGRFDDPIMNTMLRWSDTDIVATLFHELAHQQLYKPGDTEFNESFATVVEEAGIRRWLSSRGEPEQIEQYAARQTLRDQVTAIVLAARDDLEKLYARDQSDESLRAAKARRLTTLAADIRQYLAEQGATGYDWLLADLNNARLASFTAYRGRVGEFRDLLAACEDDLACFYRRAKSMLDQPPADR